MATDIILSPEEKAWFEKKLERKFPGNTVNPGFVCGYCMALSEKEKPDDIARALYDRANKALMPDMTGLTMSLVPGKEKEWIDFADKNTKDAYSACCVKAVMLIGAGLDKGMSPEEADKEADELGLTGMQMSMITGAVGYYHPRGDEFRCWWNLKISDKQGPEANLKGNVLNPAVLHVSQK